MSNRQQEQAQKIYDEVTKFEVVLNYNDGDSFESGQSVGPLLRAQAKIVEFVKHLQSVPFQPDR